MKVITLKQGETYQPDPGWKRVSLAGSEKVSIEYFEKPPGHTSPLHHHTDDLSPGDSVCFASNEPHRVENSGTELAVGIDIFSPGRDFDFWTKRK
jgi:quercetin dioxygenase-like cupin family protein